MVGPPPVGVPYTSSVSTRGKVVVWVVVLVPLAAIAIAAFAAPGEDAKDYRSPPSSSTPP
jgi:hypothetical protein